MATVARCVCRKEQKRLHGVFQRGSKELQGNNQVVSGGFRGLQRFQGSFRKSQEHLRGSLVIYGGSSEPQVSEALKEVTNAFLRVLGAF